MTAHRRPLRWVVAIAAVASAAAAPAAAAAGWLGPSLIDDADCTTTGSGCGGRVAVDPGGATLIAWTDDFNVGDAAPRSFAATRVAGREWTPRVDLDAVAAPLGVDLRSLTSTHLTDAGDALLVLDVEGASNVVTMSRARAGGWTPARVDPAASGGSVWGHGAAGAGGETTLVLRERADGTTTTVLRARVGSHPGGAWSPSVEIARFDGWIDDVRVAVDGQGRRYVAWSERAPGQDGLVGIRMVERPPGGAWSAPRVLAEPGHRDDRALVDLWANREGHAVVAWWDGDAAGVTLWARRVAPGGDSLGVPERVADRAAGPGPPSTGVALGDRGEVAAIVNDADRDPNASWPTPSITDGRITVVERTPEGAWRETRAWGPAGPWMRALGPTGVYDGTGRLIVAWFEEHAFLEGVVENWAAVRDLSGTWSDRRLLSDFGSLPGVATDGRGNTVITTTGPQHSVLDAAGPRVTDLRIPATATAGTPLAMTASAQDTWAGTAGEARWEFGDGARAHGDAVAHTFSAAGVYEVAVTHEDLLGNTSRESRAVRVDVAPTAAPPSLPPGPTGGPVTPPIGSPTPAPRHGTAAGTSTAAPATVRRRAASRARVGWNRRTGRLTIRLFRAAPRARARLGGRGMRVRSRRLIVTTRRTPGRLGLRVWAPRRGSVAYTQARFRVVLPRTGRPRVVPLGGARR